MDKELAIACSNRLLVTLMRLVLWDNRDNRPGESQCMRGRREELETVRRRGSRPGHRVERQRGGVAGAWRTEKGDVPAG